MNKCDKCQKEVEKTQDVKGWALCLACWLEAGHTLGPETNNNDWIRYIQPYNPPAPPQRRWNDWPHRDWICTSGESLIYGTSDDVQLVYGPHRTKTTAFIPQFSFAGAAS